MIDDTRGLTVMLEQLGIVERPLLTGVLMIALFEATIVGLASAQAYMEYRFSWHPVIVFVVFWLVWTFWHSWLFPRNRLHYLATSDHPYRRAFLFDIYPWVSAGFSQMWRPLINGDTVNRVLHRSWGGHPAAAIGGAFLAAAAPIVMILALRTIGIHNAAFLREFVECDSFVPMRQGIYNYVMHPLFWSGVLFSCGLAIVISTRVAYEIAVANLIYGVIYPPLENRRLRRVFGANYERYRNPSRTSNLDPDDREIARSRTV